MIMLPKGTRCLNGFDNSRRSHNPLLSVAEPTPVVVAVGLRVETRAVGNPLLLSVESPLAQTFRTFQAHKSRRGFSTARHSLWETAPLFPSIASIAWGISELRDLDFETSGFPQAAHAKPPSPEDLTTPRGCLKHRGDSNTVQSSSCSLRGVRSKDGLNTCTFSSSDMVLAATVVGLPLARISEQVGETEKEAQVSHFGVSGDKS
jgi:hypothetical protein